MFCVQLVGLVVEEVRRIGRQLPAAAHVLIEVQRHQLVGDPRRGLRRAAVVADAEGDVGLGGAALARVHHVRADHREMDVLAHLRQQHFARLALPQRRVQVVALDDAQQVVGRHDPLADDLDALVGEARDRRLHQIGRQLLLLDQDRAGRAVGRRPQQRCGHADHEHGRADRQRRLRAPGHGGPAVREGLGRRQCRHHGNVGHRSFQSTLTERSRCRRCAAGCSAPAGGRARCRCSGSSA